MLIIVWHVFAIPVLFGMEMPGWLRVVNDVLSPYRIPALLVLSGMLLPQSLSKPIGTYYWGKFARIVWPYLVWCVILLLMSPDADGLSIWFWLGGSYLWYLVVVAFCYAIGPVAKWVHPLLLAAGFVIVLIVLDPSTNAYIRILENAPYFFIGAALAPGIRAVLRWPWWAAAVGAGIALTWGVYSAVVIGYAPRVHPVGMLASLVGICTLAWFVNRAQSMRWIEWCGQHSLELYVAHFPAMVIAWRLGAGELPAPATYAVLTAAGLGVSLLLARYASRTPLFRLPSLRRRVPVTRPR